MVVHKIIQTTFSFLNRYWLVRHLLFWTFVYVYFSWGAILSLSNSAEARDVLTRRVPVMLPGMMFMVYSVLYLLVPLILKRNYLAFIVSFVICLLLANSIANLFFQTFGVAQNRVSMAPAGSTWRVGRYTLPIMNVTGMATTIKLFKHFYREQQRHLQALQEKTLAELQLLKAQIHPHFLFNTLNNLYAHTISQSAKAPEIVLKLSDLLRFVIYESRREAIPLEQEIELLKNYIELEKIRYDDNLEVSLTLSGNYQDKEIAPCLLLPLVENSFKHGASTQTGKSWITLNMEVREDQFYFKLINSKDPSEDPASEVRAGGIGLENVRKRLELIYPGKHQLDLTSDDDYFMVSLRIQLDTAPQQDSRKMIKTSANVVEMPVGG